LVTTVRRGMAVTTPSKARVKVMDTIGSRWQTFYSPGKNPKFSLHIVNNAIGYKRKQSPYVRIVNKRVSQMHKDTLYQSYPRELRGFKKILGQSGSGI
jgi:uncharacterized membrane protein